MAVGNKATKKATGKSTPADKGKKRAKGSDKNDARKKKHKADAPEEPRKTGKELKQARKLHKSHGEMVEQAKRLWEEIRAHGTDAEKRARLVGELSTLVEGHMHDVIFRHDAARVIQCLIQFGTAEQRAAVYAELGEHWLDLMKSTYGKFVVTKMLVYGTKEQKAGIMAAMHGHVRKLIKHQEAATILEAAFRDHANAAQRNGLVQEFYSPEFAVFKSDGVKSLGELIAAHPEKREAYLKHLGEAIHSTLGKGTVANSIVHRVLKEYMDAADAAQKHEMAAAMAEHAVSILHTRDGSLAAMQIIWHTGAKERKAIIKSFKTHVGKIAREEYGHHVLLALLDAIDDTVLVRKSILNEVVDDLAELCGDKFGRLVVLYILAPRHPRYLHPAHIATLQQGDANPFSKKAMDARRKEVREGVSGALLTAVAAHPEWALEGKTAQVVEEALVHAEGDDGLREQAIQAVLTVDAGDEGVLGHKVAGLVVKRLVNQADLAVKGEPMGMLVWRTLAAQAPAAAQTTQGCYTLAALLGDNQPASLRAQVAEVLSAVELPAADATGDNGKPLPGAVLAKAIAAVRPAGAGAKAAPANPAKKSQKKAAAGKKK